MRIRIIGGGVAGLTCALLFAKTGCTVHVYDRLAQNGRGCSWYAGGMLAPWCEMESAEPLVSEWGQESLEFWKAEFKGTQSFGSLIVAPSRDAAELKRFARRTNNFKWVDSSQIAQLEPNLDGRFTTALYFENEAHLDPRLALENLTNRLKSEFKVEFNYNTEINESEFNDSSWDWTIDCRGFSSPTAFQNLRGVKGEMLILKSSEIHFNRPIRLLHPRFPVYIVPRKTETGEDGLFMVGATMVENSERGRITARSVMELLNAAYAVHPAFGEAEIVEMGCDLRPSFPDNLPRIKRGTITKNGKGNVLHANGLYRHGFLLAPALAKRVVDVALNNAYLKETI